MRQGMPLSNAEKQRRFRERNLVVLTERAEEIAEKLMDMPNQNKLRKISRLINNHLRNPKRSKVERAVDLGRMGIAGRGKKESAETLEEVLIKRPKREEPIIHKAYMAGELTDQEFGAWDDEGKWPAKLGPRPVT
jgi:hypothetical protein